MGRKEEGTAPVVAKLPRGQFLSQQSGPPKMTGPHQSGPPLPSWSPPASPRCPRFEASPEGQFRPRARLPGRFRAVSPAWYCVRSFRAPASPGCAWLPLALSTTRRSTAPRSQGIEIPFSPRSGILLIPAATRLCSRERLVASHVAGGRGTEPKKRIRAEPARLLRPLQCTRPAMMPGSSPSVVQPRWVAVPTPHRFLTRPGPRVRACRSC